MSLSLPQAAEEKMQHQEAAGSDRATPHTAWGAALCSSPETPRVLTCSGGWQVRGECVPGRRMFKYNAPWYKHGFQEVSGQAGLQTPGLLPPPTTQLRCSDLGLRGCTELPPSSTWSLLSSTPPSGQTPMLGAQSLMPSSLDPVSGTHSRAAEPPSRGGYSLDLSPPCGEVIRRVSEEVAGGLGH